VHALPFRSLFVFSLFVFALFLTACSHGSDHKVDEPPAKPAASTPEQQSAAKLAAGLREQEKWQGALPACRAEDVTAASSAAPERGASADDQIRVRGHLTTTATKCTMMACRQCQRMAGSRLVCGEPLECCNQCGWAWAVEPLATTPLRVLRLQRAGESAPSEGSGLDCVLKHLPAPEVVVTGHLVDGDLVENADLCVVRPAK
jgi:hypothetical protein